MKHNITRRLLLLSGLLAWPASVIGGLLPGRRLKRRCRLPDHHYKVEQAVNPDSASSSRGIAWLIDGSLVDETGSESSKVQLKTFQLAESGLQRDHCRIGRVVVTITSDGHWTVSLTAEQNPALLSNPAERPQFERFRRNQFHVDVRPTGLMELNPEIRTARLGKPEFPAIPRLSFWVQKGQVKPISRRNHSDELKKYFHVIQQVEVHFSYSPRQTDVHAASTVRG